MEKAIDSVITNKLINTARWEEIRIVGLTLNASGTNQHWGLTPRGKILKPHPSDRWKTPLVKKQAEPIENSCHCNFLLSSANLGEDR